MVDRSELCSNWGIWFSGWVIGQKRNAKRKQQQRLENKKAKRERRRTKSPPRASKILFFTIVHQFLRETK
jgi:hypothetical protein